MNEKILKNKIVMITGATSGIGFETAKSIAKMGANLIIVGRDPKKGKQAKDFFVINSGNSKIEFFQADLSSQKQINKLSNAIKINYDKIDVLINNAGAMFSKRIESADGIEMTFALNHLSFFLLTNLLLDLIKNSENGRIINVSSEAHKWFPINFDDLQSNRFYRGFIAYARSKEANVLFTYALAEKLKDFNIVVNALHPGVVNTNFTKNIGGISLIMKPFFKIFGVPPKEGSRTSVYLAASEEINGISGKYFIKSRAARSGKLTYDKERQDKLWDISCKMTSLQTCCYNFGMQVN
jgi:NAD(P)-dependent dehydrogenase (short-subunit alcohol dehydrogenase family)